MLGNPIQQADPEVWDAIRQEELRQRDGLEMIASENYTSPAVLACQGSVLTNKYAEGLPGRRYYGGCPFVDQVEQLAIDRAKSLFGAPHANVQPHSGASANLAVFFAVLRPGDPILTMDLAHGGHLTHGSPVNYSGKLFKICHYGVDPVGHRIDFTQVAKLAREQRPKLILAGASAYPRIIDFAKFADIAKEVGAVLMVDMAHIAGLVAGNVHPSPVPYADFVTSTTHKTLRGPRSGFVLMTEPWVKPLNSSVFPGLQGGPLMHVIAAKAVIFREAARPEFAAYARQVVENAQTLAEEFLQAGLKLVSGGTDNHLLLVDVTVLGGMTGKLAEQTLDQAGITVNKNMIPYDPRKPMDPSGIRVGSAALTTRGMKAADMRQVARWMLAALRAAEQNAELERIHAAVKEFSQSFPVPGIEI